MLTVRSKCPLMTGTGLWLLIVGVLFSAISMLGSRWWAKAGEEELLEHVPWLENDVRDL